MNVSPSSCSRPTASAASRRPPRPAPRAVSAGRRGPRSLPWLVAAGTLLVASVVSRNAGAAGPRSTPPPTEAPQPLAAAAAPGSAPPPTHEGPAFARCERCHTTTGWGVIRDDVPFDHSRTGFPLLGRHAAVRCSACHHGARSFSGTPGACAACHQDPHRGALGASCTRCHDERGWEPRARLQAHRDTRFPLAGAHAVADCTACHGRARQETFRDTPTACVACHDRDRRRPGVEPDHIAAGYRAQCDACHTQYAWAPAQIHHDLFFPLRGAHTVAACADCHQGGRFGGTPSLCYACHGATYDAVADPPHRAQSFDHRCDKCHDDASWLPTKPAWHDGYFPIASGNHRGLRCEQCHYQGYAPQTFDCTRCHGKADTDPNHIGILDYEWENLRCYGCHPRG